MTLLIQRFLSAGVLMVWGVVLCFLYFSGRITAYLHPHFHVFAVTGGIVLVLLAMLVLVAPNDAALAGCATPKSGALWKSLLAALMLVVPLLVALSASQDAYSSTTVLNRNYVQDISQLPGAQPSANVQAAAPADASLPVMTRALAPMAAISPMCAGTRRARSRRRSSICSTPRSWRICAQLSRGSRSK